jgi:hypothetical protein
MKKLLMFLVAFVLLSGVAWAAEVLTNEKIIQLVEGKFFGEELIVATINGADQISFQTEIADIQKLSAAGVSPKIITAMVERKKYFSQYRENSSQTTSPYAVQSGKQTVLNPETVKIAFVKSNEDRVSDAISNTALNSLTQKGMEMAAPAVFESTGIGGVVGLAAAGGLFLKKAKKDNGFYIQYLPEPPNTRINANNPTEFILPLPQLLEARGLSVNPDNLTVVRLKEHKNNEWVLAAKRVELKNRQINKVLSEEVEEITAEKTRGADGQIRVRIEGFTAGNYALAFKDRNGFYQTAFSFTAENPTLATVK